MTGKPVENEKPRLKLVGLTGSLRKHSLNTRLLQVAGKQISKQGGHLEFVPADVLEVPIFNPSLLERHDLPEAVRNLAQQIAQADGFVISTPEYHHSLPGGLKNLLDWLSSNHPNPWRGKVGLLLSASNRIEGGHRGLAHMRETLESVGTVIFPELYVLHKADESFEPNGQLKNALQAKHVEHLVENFLRFAQALKTGYQGPHTP